MGVLLYKLLFTTLTHAIAEECFTPLPPPTGKETLYIQHISSFGADIKARISKITQYKIAWLLLQGHGV
jgi:hypothetical protein